MITPKTLTYFLWSEISEELRKLGFTKDELEAYRREFLLKNANNDEQPRSGSICAYNLYYFGPGPKQVAEDPEEAQRAKTVFAFAYEGKDDLLRQITHAIWDLLADMMPEDTLEGTRIQL